MRDYDYLTMIDCEHNKLNAAIEVWLNPLPPQPSSLTDGLLDLIEFGQPIEFLNQRGDRYNIIERSRSFVVLHSDGVSEVCHYDSSIEDLEKALSLI